MEDYNFWQDFFDTYQSLSDWMKFAWLVVPPTFLLGILMLLMRHRIASKKLGNQISGDLIYTIHRDQFDQLQIRQHGQQIGKEPKILMLEQQLTDTIEQ